MRYEYRCQSRGCLIEIRKRISEPDPQTHIDVDPERECGGKLEPVLSGGGFLLHGAGWARDGYK